MKKLTNREKVLRYLEKFNDRNVDIGIDTNSIATDIEIDRANVSKLLNQLYEEGLVIKIKGKPVLYTLNTNNTQENKRGGFDNTIGADKSLKKCIQQAKASILYPPRGLYSLLLGETGVGKTLFAELMHRFAIENGILQPNAPFITFNCADYASLPQLLMAQLFGSKKGSYTGSDKDRVGLVEKANNGVLLLDEVHRLPPEGQEMLFYLMDKGEFTPLGEDQTKKSNVLIICATTEEADTSLLSTFTRRIPISITIPPLRERTLEERYGLICEFIKVESSRIGREIVVSPNSLRSLLLYNCTGNVGQLKSDIQLGCANAFLKSISKKQKEISLHSTDFASHVKQGLILYKNNKEYIDTIVDGNERLSFSSDGIEKKYEGAQSLFEGLFYENLEDRVQELKQRGVEEEDINVLMSFEIESYFKELIDKSQGNINKEELSKLVEKETMDLVEEFIYFAGTKLNRVFPNKTFYGLCLHITSSIERLRAGKKIINHNLKKVIEDYKDEYILALNFATKIEKQFAIKLPVDEIGFISMFLTLGKDPIIDEAKHPIVVVAMHGRNTASSMVEVAQKLVGGYNIYAYDMHLDKNPQTAYEELKEMVVKNHRGVGVLLLVDMGSLKMFGKLIEEQTGIKVKVIEMVSTITAIECARKSLIESDINKIWESVNESISNFFNSSLKKMTEVYVAQKEKIIITVCTTGEGSAVAIKEMLEKKKYIQNEEVQIIPLNVNNLKEFYASVNKLKEIKRIVAIVGTFNPDIYGIPYVPVSDIFEDKDGKSLRNILENDSIKAYGWIVENYKKELDSTIDAEFYKEICISTIEFLKKNLGFHISEGVGTGIVLHMICAIKRISLGEKCPPCEVKDKIMSEYGEEANKLKEYMNELAGKKGISIDDDEVSFILRNVLQIYE